MWRIRRKERLQSTQERRWIELGAVAVLQGVGQEQPLGCAGACHVGMETFASQLLPGAAAEGHIALFQLPPIRFGQQRRRFRRSWKDGFIKPEH